MLLDRILPKYSRINKSELLGHRKNKVIRVGLLLCCLYNINLGHQKERKPINHHKIITQKKPPLEKINKARATTKKMSSEEINSDSFYIKQIVLKDAKFLPRRVRKRLLAPYINTDLNVKKITRLVQSIKAYYIEKGYPTTQVKVILGQNLKDGVLQLVVSIGFIEEIILNQHTVRDVGKIATAFPFYRNKPLYLPYLDQGIEQINSVPSSHATLRILPGLQEGGSLIQVDHVANNPVRLDIGGDNLGEEKTGKWRWKYNLAIDNLLSINDTILLHYNINHAKKVGTTKLHDYSLLFKLGFPIGYFNFSTTHSLRSLVSPTAISDYLYKRKIISHNYDMRFFIYKYRVNKGLLYFNFIHTSMDSQMGDIRLSTQTGIRAQFKVGTNHTGLFLKGQYLLDVSYEQDLGKLDAEKDVPLAYTINGVPKPNKKFKKVNIHFTWIKPVTLFSKLLSYQLDCAGQYSKDEIESSHQFDITRLGCVQGFNKSYTGNKGISCKQELSLHQLFSFSRWLLPFQSVIGIGLGYLPTVSGTDFNLGKDSLLLMNFTVGCRYSNNWFSFDCTYAKPLYHSKHLTIFKNSYQVIFDFAVKLHRFLY